MTIGQYVIDHAERGECKCGKCIDVGNKPDPQSTHSVDMIFMIVSPKNEPSMDEFRKLSALHNGEFAQVNPFDGKEHSYIELGAWIGDQGLALQYMALGVSLGLFKLLSGKTMLRSTQEEALQLAGVGLLQAPQ